MLNDVLLFKVSEFLGSGSSLRIDSEEWKEELEEFIEEEETDLVFLKTSHQLALLFLQHWKEINNSEG